MMLNPCGMRHQRAQARERSIVLATSNRSRNAQQAAGIMGVAPSAPAVDES